MSDGTTAQRTCPSCAEPVHADWRFCQECGAERPGLYDGDGAVEPAAPAPGELPPGGELVRWRGIDAGIVFVLSLVATFLVAGIVGIAFGESPTPAQEDTIIIVSLFANQLTLAGGVFLWLRRYPIDIRAALALGPFRSRYAGVGVLSGLIGVGISALIAGIVAKLAETIKGEPPAPPEQIPLQLEPSSAVLAVLAISTIVLAPIAEELFFRGMLHQSLRKRWRFLPAAVLSSALFGAAHLDPLVIPSIFALALVLTTMYERERSLWVPIVAHAAFNVVGFTASFLLD